MYIDSSEDVGIACSGFAMKAAAASESRTRKVVFAYSTAVPGPSNTSTAVIAVQSEHAGASGVTITSGTAKEVRNASKHAIAKTNRRAENELRWRTGELEDVDADDCGILTALGFGAISVVISVVSVISGALGLMLDLSGALDLSISSSSAATTSGRVSPSTAATSGSVSPSTGALCSCGVHGGGGGGHSDAGGSAVCAMGAMSVDTLAEASVEVGSALGGTPSSAFSMARASSGGTDGATA